MINHEKIKQEHHKLSAELSRENVLDNREHYQKMAKRFAFLEKAVNLIGFFEEKTKAKEDLTNICADTKEDPQVREMAKEELSGLSEKIVALEDEIDDMFLAEDEPEGDVIVEIRAAAGGGESALFAADLFKMYSRYIENHGWSLDVLVSHSTDIKGFKEIIFSVRGKGAFTHLKFESGVHRVQRVPETEASGRVHTSTTTVAVLIEPKEVDLQIRPEDIRVDTYRSGGAGGQHVNKTDSCVRMTHLATGTVVVCQEERSQIKNRAKAMKILKFRILEKMEREQVDKITNVRRGQVGSGDRSEKIRTYNFSERRVTDHRINLTLYRLEQVLNGEMDEVVKALLKEEKRKVFQAQGLT